MAYNNQIIYKRVGATILYGIIGFMLLIFLFLGLLGVQCLEELFYYNELYDLYGELLTEKQKNYFEDYYFNNLSYSEISSNYLVSRNAVFKQLHIVIQKLQEYEDKLQLYKKKQKLKDIIKELDNDFIKKQLEELI